MLIRNAYRGLAVLAAAVLLIASPVSVRASEITVLQNEELSETKQSTAEKSNKDVVVSVINAETQPDLPERPAESELEEIECQEPESGEADDVIDTFEEVAESVQEVYQEAIESGLDEDTAMQLAHDTAHAHGRAIAAMLQAMNEAEETEEEYEPGEEDTTLLAALIFCEAGNQCYQGMVAVGNVVMNRVLSGEFPDTIREVIYQRGQFTPVSTGWYARVLRSGKVPEKCYEAAEAAISGEIPVGESVYFARRYLHRGGQVIGDHTFWGHIEE